MNKANHSQDYAGSYDLFYEHKDYLKEAHFVSDLIFSHNPSAKRLLDLGCGTGRHALHLIELGFNVFGVDQSEHMLEKAKRRLPQNSHRFIRGDISEIRLGQTFDCVVSLFHVMSYMTTDLLVSSFFASLSEHLLPGGIAVVDFWYGPAVIAQKPEVRKKVINYQNQILTKTSFPYHDHLTNTVCVEIEIDVLGTTSKESRFFKDVHNMRYFFDHELVELSLASGLEMLELHEWMKKTGHPDHESWSAYAVLIKK